MAGFECEFVEKPPKSVQSECPICLLVLREPYQATCCGKSFCKECIEPLKANNQLCPTCNRIERFNLFHNLGLQQSLYDFQVYCTHKSKGCEWTGELRELDNHLNSDPPADKSLEGCPFTLINCPLSCAGCEKGVYRKDVKSHISDNLLSHVVAQTAQIKLFERQLEEKHHLVIQLQTRVEKVERDKLLLGQLVMGLKAKVTELDAKSRALENEVKTKNSDSTVVPKPQSDKPTLKQTDTYFTGTYKPIEAVFTMTNFEEYKRDNDYWYSPHFYTHPNGYKMCLGVVPNGMGSGKGTHLTVLVHLMRGEFDDQLKWPFRGNVTISIVNQEEDKNHVVWILRVNDNVPAGTTDRVIGIARNPKGCGLFQFLRHTNLQPKYLKNDSIKLGVKKVDVC